MGRCDREGRQNTDETVTKRRRGLHGACSRSGSGNLRTGLTPYCAPPAHNNVGRKRRLRSPTWNNFKQSATRFTVCAARRRHPAPVV
jgi:hypothetical protein